MPELPREVLLDMQRSIGNRAVAAVIEGTPPPAGIRSGATRKPPPQLPAQARRAAEPAGTWVAPFDLGVASDCGSALELGLQLRSRLSDARLRRELTELLHEVGDDPARPLPRPLALRLATLSAGAMRAGG